MPIGLEEAHRRLGTREPAADEFPALPIAEARTLSDEVLRARFWATVIEVEFLAPPEFETYSYDMPRAEILAIVEKHAYWFDPDGGHADAPADRPAPMPLFPELD